MFLNPKVIMAAGVLWNMGIHLGDTAGYDPDTQVEPQNESWEHGLCQNLADGKKQRDRVARMIYTGEVNLFTNEINAKLELGFVGFFLFFGRFFETF